MKTREPDILANVVPHNVEFWRSQPLVEKVEVLRRDVGADGSKAELAIWLRPGAVDEPFETLVQSTPPTRVADLSLGADGLCEASWFWDRLKGVEHSIYMEDFGPEWWAVELWLEQPALLR
ncbi:MAG: hypothetical protein EON94_02775 [Caulobacteraceae bacterium]|nr:MAG: hypothetical protein EON94_02775 [Caulobacteraceae bacterium]